MVQSTATRSSAAQAGRAARGHADFLVYSVTERGRMPDPDPGASACPVPPTCISRFVRFQDAGDVVDALLKCRRCTHRSPIVLIFRQLFDQQSSTYTYLLADDTTSEAVLIDPVFEQARRDTALIEELGLRLLYTIDTHVHADHVTGAWLLKRALHSQIAISAASGAEGADRYLSEGDRVAFGSRHLLFARRRVTRAAASASCSTMKRWPLPATVC
jgi:hypothetical protein